MITDDNKPAPENELSFEEHVEAQLQRAALLGECEILLAENEELLGKLPKPEPPTA